MIDYPVIKMIFLIIKENGVFFWIMYNEIINENVDNI